MKFSVREIGQGGNIAAFATEYFAKIFAANQYAATGKHYGVIRGELATVYTTMELQQQEKVR